ncbi:MAG: methyltransferase domain-containing protein [Candidatus Heimdallarchaeota archaeon]|nr:methyltransferase domain-containing protein [Candidatus Heimdallarchaeota archaeon]
MKEQEVFNKVKEQYGNFAKQQMVKPLNMIEQSCCSSAPEQEIPSLGCYNNLIEAAGIKEGEIVLDLGSGPGHDLLMAADVVGPTGKAIGVDMTQEMLELGRKNAAGYKNVEILEGNLQAIPLEDNSVDVIISNCVFNLTPDKSQAFKEAYRVLKPGGRIIESDIALRDELPDEVKNDDQVYCGCVGGALKKEEYLTHMRDAGFSEVEGEELFEGSYTIKGKQYEYISVLFKGYKPT